MKELIEYIAKSLVDDPEAVEVDQADGEVATWNLRVAVEDRGKVIGRKGRTAHAIRTLMAAATDEGEAIPSLDIVD